MRLLLMYGSCYDSSASKCDWYKWDRYDSAHLTSEKIYNCVSEASQHHCKSGKKRIYLILLITRLLQCNKVINIL